VRARNGDLNSSVIGCRLVQFAGQLKSNCMRKTKLKYTKTWMAKLAGSNCKDKIITTIPTRV
jgi:hypothetical protein